MNHSFHRQKFNSWRKSVTTTLYKNVPVHVSQSYNVELITHTFSITKYSLHGAVISELIFYCLVYCVYEECYTNEIINSDINGKENEFLSMSNWCVVCIVEMIDIKVNCHG